VLEDSPDSKGERDRLIPKPVSSVWFGFSRGFESSSPGSRSLPKSMSSKSPNSTETVLSPPPEEDIKPAPLQRLVARDPCESPESDISGDAAGLSINPGNSLTPVKLSQGLINMMTKGRGPIYISKLGVGIFNATKLSNRHGVAEQPRHMARRHNGCLRSRGQGDVLLLHTTINEKETRYNLGLAASQPPFTREPCPSRIKRREQPQKKSQSKPNYVCSLIHSPSLFISSCFLSPSASKSL